MSAALGVTAAVGLVAGTLAHNARLRAEVTRTEQQAKEAREHRERADAQYRSARDAIGRMAHRFNEPRFAGLTIPAEFRRQILEDALAFYEGAVRDDGPSAFAERIDKVRALGEVATFQSVLGRDDDAERTLRRGLAMVERLDAEELDHPDVLSCRVGCLTKLGLAISGDAKRCDEAVAYLASAIEAAERLVRDDPFSCPDGDLPAWCHHDLGSVLQHACRYDEAEVHYRRAAEIREALIARHPEQFALRGRLAETLINLALIHSNPTHARSAEAEYARAVDLLVPLLREHSEFNALILSVAKLYLNWGGLALLERRTDRAIELNTLGLAEVDRVDRIMPGWSDARHVRRNLHGAMAQAHEQASRFAEAARQWSLTIELSEGDDCPKFRLLRACDLARAGDDVLAAGRRPRGSDAENQPGGAPTSTTWPASPRWRPRGPANAPRFTRGERWIGSDAHAPSASSAIPRCSPRSIATPTSTPSDLAGISGSSASTWPSPAIRSREAGRRAPASGHSSARSSSRIYSSASASSQTIAPRTLPRESSSRRSIRSSNSSDCSPARCQLRAAQRAPWR